jgi:hypothetical protein
MENCKHVLDTRTVKGVDGFDGSDGSIVVEVGCKKCGQSGSFRLLPGTVNFDLDKPHSSTE